MKRFLRRPRHVRTQHGIALLECLMALLIFSFGLLGLLGLEARVMNISTDSEDRSRASLIASEIASQMWLNNTVSATAPPILAVTGNAGNQALGGLPNGVATVAQIGTTNVADITITWQEISDATPNTLVTRVILP
jgi:type IV pilus assembly protein PilV